MDAKHEGVQLDKYYASPGIPTCGLVTPRGQVLGARTIYNASYTGAWIIKMWFNFSIALHHIATIV